MTFPIENLISAETLRKFKIYENLLRSWNRRTALVQEETLQDFYTRHILDSLQIVPLIESLVSSSSLPAASSITLILQPETKLDNPPGDVANTSIIDVGTGAGFPGLALAICGFANVTLCESNHRKCIFLEEVARQTDTNVTITNKRAEDVEVTFDVILSRACADLKELCSLMENLSRDSCSLGIFHKGKSWKDELQAAQKNWEFKTQIYQSLTSFDGVILALRELVERR